MVTFEARMSEVTVYLLLGSNLGDRAAQLQSARQSLEKDAGPIQAVSPVYSTAPWGVHDQPNFLNQAIALNTALSATALLERTQRIESAAGPPKKQPWGARWLDIDILLFGNQIIDLPHLKVPHPHLPSRRFALIPLCAIASNIIHPENGHPIAALLDATTDTLAVEKWSPHVA